MFRNRALLLASLAGSLALTGCSASSSSRTTQVTARQRDLAEIRNPDFKPPPLLQAVDKPPPLSGASAVYQETLALPVGPPPLPLAAQPAPPSDQPPASYLQSPAPPVFAPPLPLAAQPAPPSAQPPASYPQSPAPPVFAPPPALNPPEGSISIVSGAVTTAADKGGETVTTLPEGLGRQTLTGRVESWRKTWRLRYAPVDAEDSHGGSVILVGDHEQLANLCDGQRLLVRGVMIPASDRLATRRFLVESVKTME